MHPTTTSEASQRSIETRLDRTAAAVDGLVTKVRDVDGGVTGRLGSRVDAVRAQEAAVRTRLREMHEADRATWAANAAEIGRELDKLETEMAIAAAQLAAELATDESTFVAAVEAELAAWDARIETMRAGAAPAGPAARVQLNAAVTRIREQRAAASRELRRLRAAAATAAPVTAHGRLRRALADLDCIGQENIYHVERIRRSE